MSYMRFLEVEADGSLTERSKLSLDPEKVLIVIDEDKKQMWLLRGQNAPVRRKFIAARVFSDLTKRGYRGYIADNVSFLLELTGAPSYEEALKVQQGGFRDYAEYQEAQQLGAPNKEALELTLKLKAPNYSIAREILEGGFSDYQTYQQARATRYKARSEQELAQKRKGILENLARRTKRISIDDFMLVLDFTDRRSFYHWLLSLPHDILTIDGDYVIFTFASASSSHSDVDDAIDRLLAEFSSFERSKNGKV